MDDREWDACERPAVLLAWLGGVAPKRKLRLFACARLRWHWPRFRHLHTRNMLLVAELHAEGRATDQQLVRQKELVAGIIDGEAGDEKLATRLAWGTGGTAGASPAALVLADLADQTMQVRLIRDIFGNPFRPPPGRERIPRMYVCQWCRRLREFPGSEFACCECGK